MKRRSFLAPAPTPRSLPATSRPVPRRITPEDAAKIVSQDIDLTGDILSSIAQAVIAAGLVGTITVASGSSRFLNGIGAAASLVAMTPIVNVLRKKRAWEVLSLIERANNQDTQAAIFAALAERAIQYQEKGITVMQSVIDIDADDEMYALPPSSTQEFAPQFATAPAYDEYEPEEDEYEPAPMMQAQAQVHQPMTMMAQPTIAAGALASRFRQQEDPIHVDPIAAKYGKTIASITDMHSPHSKPRHLAFLAVTQCGKTTTLGAVSYALAERYPGSVFVALDGKNSEWAPFYSSTVYPGLLSTYNPKAVIQFLRDAGEELEDRVSRKAKNESRLFVILDEWNSVRDELKAFNVEMCSEADLIVNALVLRGLEYGIHVIIVCQEVNCSKLGFTDAGRGNVHFLALGRSGDKTMVDLLLSGEQILKSKFQREHLQQDFLKVWNDTSRPEMSPVLVDSRAYTAEALPNFSGMIQLVKKDAPPPTRSTPIAPAQSAPPRSPQPRPMLQLAPSQQGGIMDDLPTASELEPLPPVASHIYQFEGMQPVTMKEPPILRVLNERDNVRAIVRALIDWGGTAEARKVQQQRQCAALRTPSGNPYNAEMIARYMAFLAENYPEYFGFDGKTLTATDQEVLTWQLRK